MSAGHLDCGYNSFEAMHETFGLATTCNLVDS